MWLRRVFGLYNAFVILIPGPRPVAVTITVSLEIFRWQLWFFAKRWFCSSPMSKEKNSFSVRLHVYLCDCLLGALLQGWLAGWLAGGCTFFLYNTHKTHTRICPFLFFYPIRLQEACRMHVQGKVIKKKHEIGLQFHRDALWTQLAFLTAVLKKNCSDLW